MSIVLQYFETASLSTNVFSINFHFCEPHERIDAADRFLNSMPIINRLCICGILIFQRDIGKHKMKLHVFKNIKPKQAHDLKTMWTLMDKKATANTVLCF